MECNLGLNLYWDNFDNQERFLFPDRKQSIFVAGEMWGKDASERQERFYSLFSVSGSSARSSGTSSL